VLRRKNNGQSTMVCGYGNTDIRVAEVCVEDTGKSTVANERESYTVLSTVCQLDVEKIEDGQ